MEKEFRGLYSTVLTKEDYNNIFIYYKEHSIYHNPEQFLKDLDKSIELLKDYIDSHKHGK